MIFLDLLHTDFLPAPPGADTVPPMRSGMAPRLGLFMWELKAAATGQCSVVHTMYDENLESLSRP